MMKLPVTQFAREHEGSLPEHLRSCIALLGPGFRMRCIAEEVHAFVAPRFVTTVCVSCLILFSAAMAF
jgi:hypothetical protein